MTQRFDADALQAVIEDGRRRHLPSKQIAASILEFPEDPRWVTPVRAQVLRLMREEGELSPVGAFGRVDDGPLGTLSYHFRHLRELGLVELSHTVPRRGAVEHRYRLAQ